jgi:hypothetical protein
MNYNQVIATTTNYDLFDAPTGYSVRITTYGFADLLILFIIAIMPFVLIAIFKKRK